MLGIDKEVKGRSLVVVAMVASDAEEKMLLLDAVAVLHAPHLVVASASGAAVVVRCRRMHRATSDVPLAEGGAAATRQRTAAIVLATSDQLPVAVTTTARAAVEEQAAVGGGLQARWQC